MIDLVVTIGDVKLENSAHGGGGDARTGWVCV